MRFSSLTQRIAGDGAAAWDIHYRALAMLEQGRDVLLLSVGDPDFDTPTPIVQAPSTACRPATPTTPTCAASAACVRPSPGGTGSAAARR
jgi:aspartate/methionine/tyrosine aminotransferase